MAKKRKTAVERAIEDLQQRKEEVMQAAMAEAAGLDQAIQVLREGRAPTTAIKLAAKA